MRRVESLQYVRDHAGQRTRAQFIEMWRPVGDMEWGILLRDGLVDDANGFIHLTIKGANVLEELENK